MSSLRFRGTEFIQFLVELDLLHQCRFEEKDEFVADTRIVINLRAVCVLIREQYIYTLIQCIILYYRTVTQVSSIYIHLYSV